MRRHWLTAALGCAAWSAASAQSADPLLDGFRDPPASARPRSWWHWLNGNITAEGLIKDLEWMKAIGLGGVQAFDASLGTPQLVPHPLAYMTPEWKAAFNGAAATADRLGLELGISSSPGWSETGGPWVPPADGMKKLVWSTLDVAGGQRVAQPLPAPPAVTGPYGTAPYADPMATPGVKPTPDLSGPVAVFAYPIDAEMIVPPGAISVEGGGVLDAAALTDAREDTTVKLPQRVGTVSSVLVTWPSQRTIRSATLFVPGAIAPFGGAAFAPVLEAEQAGGWTRVADLPLGNVPTTVAFAPVTARRFRVRFLPSAAAPPSLSAPAPGAVVANIFATPAPDQPITVATLSLTSEERVDQFEQKAGFAAVPDYYALSTTATEVGGIAARQVIDLSSRMRPNGRLDWTPPKGRWRIVRMGWSLLGTTNHPAAVDATGLEVDKYDGAAVRRYMDHYLATYQPAVAAGAVKALVTDSIEAGDANWTPALLERFQALRGYDPRPWLPALTGAVIGSRFQSDAFLYDWRRTLADLLASEHYGTIAIIAHANKLLVYGEALENGRPQLGDDMQMRAQADVPMAAMWAFGRGEPPRSTLIGDIYGAASVAHLTGRNLVAAESFTAAFSPWAFAPADLKRVADLEFGLGVNRPVIHTSVSSPMDDKLPGLSLAIFGQYFNRRDTWSGMARPWVDYLARTSYLMQQGHHVADLAYFIGEEAPLTALFDRNAPADLPKRRGFDFVDAEFLTKLSADKDGIGSAGGAHYRLLYLGGTSRHMTLPTLRHIADLVQAGAIVVGPAPVATPSLADDAKAFQTLVARLWPGAAVARVGAGRVYATSDVEAAFNDLSLPQDVTTEQGEVLFQHRALSAGDIYFVHNRGTAPVTGGISFRTAGRVPELWNPDTGLTRPLSYRRAGAYTWVDLPLSSEGTALVTFRSAATASSRTVPPPHEIEVSEADPAWTVDFEMGRGAPTSLALLKLEDLSRRSEAGVRYFSGTATYQGSITLKHREPGARLMLDLGRVGDVAQVRVNGIEVGAAWQAPYRVNVTKAVRLGTNRIEIRVANLWVNRLIGDAQPGADKITFVVAPTYRPDAPLRPSGLIGPVRLIAETRVEEATERSAP